MGSLFPPKKWRKWNPTRLQWLKHLSDPPSNAVLEIWSGSETDTSRKARVLRFGSGTEIRSRILESPGLQKGPVLCQVLEDQFRLLGFRQNGTVL